MRTKFFLCMRPAVIETEDGGYVKIPSKVGTSYSAVSDKTSGRRNRDLQHRKMVAAERYIRQLSIKSNSNCFSGNISEGKSENPVEKDSQKRKKTACPVSEPNVSIPSSAVNSVPLKIMNTISSGKDSGGPESNSGMYLMVSSLFFTIYLGKFLGILCTLILMMIRSLYLHRKNDHDDDRRSKNTVAKSPEKGSPKEYRKRIIMEGLLERKSHNRESIKFFS